MEISLWNRTDLRIYRDWTLSARRSSAETMPGKREMLRRYHLLAVAACHLLL
jgi:hypothetical protein